MIFCIVYIFSEEILKTKMLAFEEMRKRLEEQHAQQLSILIAEQEREQEKLQKVKQKKRKNSKLKSCVLKFVRKQLVLKCIFCCFAVLENQSYS